MAATLRQVRLLDASVPRTASFLEAAQALASGGISAIAVLDEGRRVAGLFTEDDLVAGLFPLYLRELRHTAFARDDETVLAQRARAARAETVELHMSEPVTIEIDTSATHAAERFLHVPWGALAVVDEQRRFVGMLSQIELVRWLLERLEDGGVEGE